MDNQNPTAGQQGQATPAAAQSGQGHIDFDKMSDADLENLVFASSLPAEEGKQADQVIPPPASPAPQPAKGQQAEQTQGTQGENPFRYEIDVDGEKIRVRDEDSLKNGFAESQRFIRRQKQIIDQFNAERGQLGQKVKELEAELGTVKSAQGQLSQGQQLTQENKDLLTDLGFDPDKIDVYDEATMKNAFKALVQSTKSLRSELEKARSQEPESLKKIQERLDKFEKSETQRSTERTQQDFFNGLFSEIEGVQKEDTTLTTSVPVRKIDALITEYGRQAVEQMGLVPVEDLKKFDTILDYTKVYSGDENGNIVLGRKNAKDLKEAIFLHKYRTGQISKERSDLYKKGFGAFEQASQKLQQGAVTIPNGSGTPAVSEGMSQAEIADLLKVDIRDIQKNPILKEKMDRLEKQMGVVD